VIEMKKRDIIETLVYILIGYLIAFGANKGLSYALDTDYPVVAVVSTSMEHRNMGTFYGWLLEHNYTQSEIAQWPFQNGINKGDLVVVRGVDFDEIEVGDVIVYKFPNKEPVIHRVVGKSNNTLITKGDNNRVTDQQSSVIAPPITEENVEGRAVMRIPLLGWVKVIFSDLMSNLRG